MSMLGFAAANRTEKWLSLYRANNGQSIAILNQQAHALAVLCGPSLEAC